jgi:hypothetical protein
LGSALFAHVVAFVGISYWDQTQVVWYGLLAAISAAVLVRPESRVTNKVRSKALNWADPAAELAVGNDDDIFESDSASQHSPAF